MKLVAVLCLTVMLLIPINIVSVQAQKCYECGDPQNLTLHDNRQSSEVLNQTVQQQAEHIKQLEEQHSQDLQIIQSLVALSIVLGFVVIGLGVILYKKRNLKMKSNPES